MMLFAKRDFVARAAQALAAAEAAAQAVGGTARERSHLAALRDWVRGDWVAALARWEAILLDHPRDLVALRLAQYSTLYKGDSEGLRDSVGRVLYAWDDGVPGYGFVLGAYAFGLEEAGDYAAVVAGAVVAVIERKTLENLATSLSDGGLAFQMQRLAEVARAAIVVEGDYPDLFRTQPGRGSWLADMLGRLAVRYPEVPVVFAGSRRFAEEWAYRFLGAAVADRIEST